MPFAVAGAAIGAAGALGSAAMQSSASGRAANAARHQQEMLYKIQEAKLQPYVESGQQGWNQLNALMGLQGQDAANAALTTFQQSPGYQWTMDQGLRAVDAGAAASGLARSGAALKAEQTFGQGLANQEFGNYINNLFQISRFGQNSAVQEATNAGNVGNNLSKIATDQGAADAAIYGQLGKGLGSAVNDLFGNQKFQNWLNGPSVSGDALSGYTVPNTYDIGAGTGVYSGQPTF